MRRTFVDYIKIICCEHVAMYIRGVTHTHTNPHVYKWMVNELNKGMDKTYMYVTIHPRPIRKAGLAYPGQLKGSQ